VFVSSSGNSVTATTSYGPTVQYEALTVPPSRSASSPAAFSRSSAPLKSRMPSSVQFRRLM
jgi:hypothetical protein